MRLVTALAALALVVGSSSSQSQSAPPMNWQRLSPPDGGFGIDMPCLAPEKVDASSGRHTFMCGQPIGVFAVTYTPSDISAQLLEKLPQAMARQLGDRLLYDREGTFQGYPGRRFTLFDEAHQKFTSTIVVATGSRVYMIQFVSPQENAITFDHFNETLWLAH